MIAEDRLRIIIVDPSSDVATAQSLVLQQLGGHTTFIANDGKRAIELAAGVCPDVMLLELRLPGLDGYEAIDLLRRQLPDTDLLVLTGYSTPAHVDRCHALSVPHLLKPSPPEKLLNVLRDIATRRYTSANRSCRIPRDRH